MRVFYIVLPFILGILSILFAVLAGIGIGGGGQKVAAINLCFLVSFTLMLVAGILVHDHKDE